MLNKTVKHYFIFTLIVYLLFFIKVDTKDIAIYLFNFTLFISYFLLIDNTLKFNLNKFNKINLKRTVFLYSFIVVGFFNLLSYIYNDNFFVFSEGDAMFYHLEASYMSNLSFIDSINYYLKVRSIDDLGTVIFISTLYRFIASNLLVNIAFIFLSIYTSVAIFKISKNFMDSRFAYLAAITYSLSSYALWFSSAGLKEPIMIALVVGFYQTYYSYMHSRKPWKIVLLITILLSLLLFRIPIALFCINSIVLSALLFKKMKVSDGILIFVVVMLTIALFPTFETSYNRYLYGGNFEQLAQSREGAGLVIGSYNFSMGVNILAQLIGPLPSVSPSHVKHLSFYAPGLILRVLLSVPFWFGVYYAYKTKNKTLFPIILFILFEMISLILLLEGLELRKSLLHFPFIIIVAFWFMWSYEKNDYLRFRFLAKKTILIYLYMLFLIIVYWNSRY